MIKENTGARRNRPRRKQDERYVISVHIVIDAAPDLTVNNGISVTICRERLSVKTNL